MANPDSEQFGQDNFNDTLLGSDASRDLIDGRGGNDILLGLGGDDTLIGSAGNDVLLGGSGNDSLQGGPGADTVNGGSGDDTLDGGAILDRTSYSDNNFSSFNGAPAGAVINLQTGVAQDGWGGIDTLVDIDFVQGTGFADSITGSSAYNLFEQFEGMAGNDTIDGSAIDPITGNNGNRVAYHNSTGAVVVDLGAGTAQDGFGTTDILLNINQVRGSNFNDSLTGSNTTVLSEFFEGRAGNDTINGMGGTDIVRYDAATTGVQVNLAAGTAQDGQGGTDTLINIEGAYGSNFADVLTGGLAANGSGALDGLEIFRGGGGNDTIDGGAGYDRVDYGSSTSAVHVTLGGTSNGTALDGLGGTDTLINIEAVRGGDFNDVLTGSDSASFESFEGRRGNDTINGMGGTDRADYSADWAAVNVNLATGLANDGFGGTDTLISIEQARGSAFNDTLVGGGGNGAFQGNGGDDTLTGGGGSDTFIYLASGQGLDLITDFAAGDMIEVRTVLATTTPTAGDGSAVAGKAIQVSSKAGVTTLHIDTNNVAGADLQIQLAGIYSAAGFTAGNTAAGYTQLMYSGGVSLGSTLSGTAGADSLVGGPVNDSLSGLGGDDTLIAGSGRDTLLGGDGNDSLLGGGGQDFLSGGTGNDTLDGGAILDRINYNDLNTVGYLDASSGVVINLQSGAAQDGLGGVDTLTNINFVQGSNFNDSITGSSTFNLFEQFEGFAGNDTIDGGAIDAVTGNNGNRATYENAPAAVSVNLGTGIALDGYGTTDTLLNITLIRGSAFNDTLTGSDTTVFTESFEGRAGNDTIDGKGGNDQVRYDAATSGVTVNLATGTASDGQAGTDTLLNIEGVRGSNFADSLTGGLPANGSGATDGFEFFQGNAGNDTINGGAGYDRVDFNSSTSGVNVTLGGAANGSAVDGLGGVDTLINIEAVRGSEFSDVLTGSDTGNFESFEGRAGNDTIDGMGGTDRADYNNDWASVEVNLGSGIAYDGFGGTDTLINIENARGSAFDDDLVGNSGANQLDGRGGNDILEGWLGSDTLTGGAGVDEFILTASQVDIDRITDLQAGELIFLDFDDELNQQFLTGTDASGLDEGDVMFAPASGGSTRVYIGINGTLGADLTFELTGSFSAIDFVAALNDEDGSALLSRPGAVNLTGTSEAEWLYGSNYADTVAGQDGNDTIFGYGGNDSLMGNGGDDEFTGDAGNDTIHGGAGFDRVHYDLPGTMATGVNVNLATGTVTSGASTDVLVSVEGATGTDLNDTLTGSTGINVVWGAEGNDLIFGQAVAGGAYQGAATGGDTLAGEGGDDTIQGSAGNDILYGGFEEGEDEHDAPGADTFVFLAAGNGVDLIADFEDDDVIRIGSTLSTATPTNGDGASVNGKGIQVLTSGSGEATLTTLSIDTNSTAGAEVQIQLSGSYLASQFNVTANGDGTSSIRYVFPSQNLVGTAGSDTLIGDRGNDTLSGLDGFDSLNGGSGNDSILGGAGGDMLQGGAGNDTLDGGADVDTAAYWDAQSGVSVNLATGTASAEGLGTDSLSNIEIVYGSWGNDTLVGDGNNNRLVGNSGNDSLSGGMGDDVLDGNSGSDTLTGGDGADLFVVREGPNGEVDRVTDLSAGDALQLGFTGQMTLVTGSDATGLLAGQYVIGSPSAGVTRLSVGVDTTTGADRYVDLVGSFTADQFIVLDSFGSGGMMQFGYILKYDPTAGLPKNLTGTAGFDTLTGGNGNDTLAGLDGNDSLVGNDGNDSLLGGAGWDMLRGGAGDDTLDGGAELDTANYSFASAAVNVNLATGIATGEGTDSLTSIETVYGSNFNDTLTGDASANQLNGNLGNDSLVGNQGDDFLDGGYGNDTLTGGDGADLFYVTYYGVNGEIDRVTDLSAGDALQLGWSSMTLLGGTDATGLLAGQFVIGSPSAGVTRLSIGMDTFAGADRHVDLVGSFTADQFIVLDSFGSGGMMQFGYIFKYDPTAGLPKNLTGTASSDTLTGGNGNDTLAGLDAGDSLSGNGGNDSLLGGAGWDTLQGGAGDDTLDGGADTDTADYGLVGSGVNVNLSTGLATGEGTDTLVSIETIYGSNFNDTLAGDAVANQINGYWGNDSIVGNQGDDFLDGGYSNDTLTGGDGADLFMVSYGLNGEVDRVADLSAGDALQLGWPTMTLLGGTDATGLLAGQFVTGAPSAGVTRLSIGMDTLAGADRYVDLVGSFTADQFIALNSFGSGAMTQYGYILKYDPTASLPKNLTGTAGFDTLTGGNGNDTLAGLDGDDSLLGNGGDDNISGNAGNDTIFGGDGNDFINGGPGNDLIYAGEGNDEINAGGSDNDGGDIIDGGAGYDFVDYGFWGETAPVVFTLSDGGAQFDPVGGTDTLIDIEEIHVFGGSGSDTLTGNSQRSYLQGNNGNDTLTGGGGNDTFAYDVTQPAGVDRITDLQAGEDLNFFIPGGIGGTFNLVGAVQSGDNASALGLGQVMVGVPTAGITRVYVGTNATPGADITIELQGSYSAAEFSISNFSWGASLVYVPGQNLTGTDGNDNLNGSNGPDTLTGLNGNDILNGGGGNDTILGGAGRDTLIGGVGNDSLDGGVITDRIYYTDQNFVSYAGATSAVNVNLQTGTASDGQGGTDSLANLNFVFGSNFGDTFTGSTTINLFEQFEGGLGDDTINGGAIDPIQQNSNRSSYVSAGAAVNVNLAQGTATGGAGNDTLININHVTGSNFADTLTGSNSSLTEQFEGRGGNDTIDGAGGIDVARYDGATSGVNANLVTGVATDGLGGTDTLLNIEGLRGSNFGDLLTGGNTANGTGITDGFELFSGFEYFIGNAGNDIIDGGGGYDRVDYTTSTAGVNVTLGGSGNGTASDGLGGTDTLINIEAVRGSAFNDILTGSDTGSFESFEGREGNDVIDGKGGMDRVDYLSAIAAVNVDIAAGTAQDGYGGTDTFTHIENARGSAFNDVLVGDAGANRLEGYLGDDTLTGGTGNDVFAFAPNGAGVDTLTDFALGDIIGIGTGLASGTASAGNGSAVTGKNVQVASSAGVTTLYIDTDNIAGADLQIRLQGTFNASGFEVTNLGNGTSRIVYGNSLGTGDVQISGTATQGQTLTASNTLADADGIPASGVGAISYQWLGDGTAIGGATASTFTLTQAQVGKVISVKASYTDLGGTAESKTSTATAAVANINDAPTGAVTVSGTPTQGQVLTAANSLADADGIPAAGATGAIAYQWLAGDNPIGGATASTFTLTQAQVGKAISVKASYTDLGGMAESKVSAATAAVVNVNDAPTGAVTVSGTAKQGQTLTASNTLADADGIPASGVGAISYQWLAGETPIGGATASTFTLTQAQVGKAISVKASYTDLGGMAESKTSAATAAVTNVNDAPTGAVTVSGTPTQGQTLTAANTLADADGILGAIAYQWLAGGNPISGATASTFTLTQAQVGKAISVKASYTDLGGAAESKVSAATAAVANINDAPTGNVTVSGTPAQSQTLTAANTLADADGIPGAIAYQWLAGGNPIGGATASSFTLTQAQVGKAISVTASYTDNFGMAESKVSAATAAVANINDAPTGAVTVSGTPAQGQTLTAANTLADADGIPGAIAYQWLAGGNPIGGATASTFTLTQAQVGKAISVKASYTDLGGTAESKTSAPTAAVANTNDAPTGSVTVTGAATKGQTLTAANTLADLDGMGTVSYQWFAGGSPIAGATASTFTLTQAEGGKAISVKASYVDALGTAESMFSAPTALVVLNNPPTGNVSLAGTATQGQTLTASNTLADVDGIPGTGAGAIRYQWLADGNPISGATVSTFMLTQAQVGKAVSVKASYTDNLGAAESKTSAATAAVANINDALTGSVTVSGTATQGQTLTAFNSLADADGIPSTGVGAIGYQWLADGSAIGGATASTFILTQAQVGKAISVKASYTDKFGTAESKTSSSTARIANINDAPVNVPLIAGIPTQGNVLKAGIASIGDPDGLGAFSYQWLANGGAIAGATSAALTLAQAHVGKAISVQVRYVDGFGATETVKSTPTTAVANVNDLPTGTINITGVGLVGLPLSADTSTLADADGLGVLGYQWLADNAPITGGTLATFTPTVAQAGKSLTVKVSYTDKLGAAEAKTSATGVLIQKEDDAPALTAAGKTSLKGDGNGDGVLDSTQSGVASAALAKTGSTDKVFVTLVADSKAGTVDPDSGTAQLQTVAQKAAPADLPGTLKLPLGLLDFTAKVSQAGQTETFSLYVDSSLNVNGYWKQDASGTWVNLASAPHGGAVTTEGNKTRLDFRITDGGEFDNDGKADGIITDPGAAGAMPLSLVGYAPDVTLKTDGHFFF